MVSFKMDWRGWKDDVPRPKKCCNWVKFWPWDMGKSVTENVICIRTRLSMDERHFYGMTEGKRIIVDM